MLHVISARGERDLSAPLLRGRVGEQRPEVSLRVVLLRAPPAPQPGATPRASAKAGGPEQKDPPETRVEQAESRLTAGRGGGAVKRGRRALGR